MKRALGYAVEGVRLLRSHPSLVLVALAMGVLGTVDGRVGPYLTFRYTDWGRDVRAREAAGRQRHRSDPRLREVEARIRRLARQVYWAGLTAESPPQMDLGGSVGLMLALPYGVGGSAPWQEQRHPRLDALITAPVRFLLPLLIGGLIMGGYLWVLREAVRSGRSPWRAFLAPGWGVWWRLGIFTAVGTAPLAGAAGLAAMGAGSETAGIVLAYIQLPLLLVLALTPFVIVADRTGIFRAVLISARMVAANLATALVLVVGASAVSGLAFRFSPTVQVFLAGGWEAGTRSLAGLPLDAALRGVAYVIAAWYSAAMLIWYDDLTRGPSPESPALC